MGLSLGTTGQLRTWADDLNRIYSAPIDGSFDDLLRRLDRAAAGRRFGKKKRS
jgi:hypothetical protein